jgi:putative acetyltransferase
MDARNKPGHDGEALTQQPFILRPYTPADEDAAIGLWFRTWQQAYPDIDFSARLEAWRQRWRDELVPAARIMVAEQNDAEASDGDGAMIGFVTVDSTGYLDQLVVSPEQWGSDLANALITEAKRLSPAGLTLLVNSDNARAVRFYARNGFVYTHDDVNPASGRRIQGMKWMP